MYKCEICGKGPLGDENVPIYRNGPTGQIVPWRCIEHLDPEYKPDKDVKELTEMISNHPLSKITLSSTYGRFGKNDEC